jgi:hypothetical protein
MKRTSRGTYLAAAALACAVLISGCGPARRRPPSYSPSSAGSQALELFDANGNGTLDGAELAKSPGLASAVKRWDGDGDGALSADEIATRIETYRASGIGLMPFSCTVYLDNQRLSGAEVTLVPEPFLEGVLQPAKAVTSTTGIAAPAVDGNDFPAVPCGLYRVQISKKDAAGNESIPARYNSATELGQDIGPDVPGLERGVEYRLVSR